MTAIAPEPINNVIDSNSLWKSVTWEKYLAYWQKFSLQEVKLFFHQGDFLMEVNSDEINYDRVSDLLQMMITFWFANQGDKTFRCLGRWALEKLQQVAAVPDLILYIGEEDAPSWQEGERRSINLEKWQVPDLIGEIADDTSASDLERKKQIYAALGIPECWIIYVEKRQVLVLQLQDNGQYEQKESSAPLQGLPIAMIEDTLQQLDYR